MIRRVLIKPFSEYSLLGLFTGFSSVVKECEYNFTILGIKGILISTLIKSKFIDKVMCFIIIIIVLLSLIDLDNLFRLNNYNVS